MKLEHAEAVYELSKKMGGDGVRPMHKNGLLGLFGPKVDSIEYWSTQIRELTTQLDGEQGRVRVDEQEGAALVFFNNRRSAAEAAQVLQSAYVILFTTKFVEF